MIIKTHFSKHSLKEIVSPHAAEDYQKTLKKLGYNMKLLYKQANQNTNNKRNCKRNII